MTEWLQCIACERRYDIMELRYRCECDDLLSIERDEITIERTTFDQRIGSRSPVDRSGVWRFREAVLDVPTSDELYMYEWPQYPHTGIPIRWKRTSVESKTQDSSESCCPGS